MTGAEAGLTGEDAMFESAKLTAFSTVTEDGSKNPLSDKRFSFLFFINRGGLL